MQLVDFVSNLSRKVLIFVEYGDILLIVIILSGRSFSLNLFFMIVGIAFVVVGGVSLISENKKSGEENVKTNNKAGLLTIAFSVLYFILAFIA